MFKVMALCAMVFALFFAAFKWVTPFIGLACEAQSWVLGLAAAHSLLLAFAVCTDGESFWSFFRRFEIVDEIGFSICYGLSTFVAGSFGLLLSLFVAPEPAPQSGCLWKFSP